MLRTYSKMHPTDNYSQSDNKLTLCESKEKTKEMLL